MHHLSVRLSLIILTLALALSPASAGSPAAVTGRIVDQDGRPVAGARVLVSGDGLPLLTGDTGDDGEFSIAAPDDVRLTVRVAKAGFRAEPVTIEAGAPRELAPIRLSVSAVSESIVVSASQVEAPLSQATASVTVITGAELQSRQVLSVADALRFVPGLAVVTTGGVGATTGVFPRGGESNYTLVLVDGVPVNAFGGDFDFGQVSTINVDRIEIVRGPQSALYGANAIGGVVRIVTRRGGAPSANVAVEAGGFGTSRVSASTAGQSGALEWGALFDRLASDGMNGERSDAGETIGNDDYERTSGAASVGWRRGSSWVRGDLRHSSDDRGFPGPYGSNPIGAFSGVDVVSRGENERSQASVSMSAPLSARTRLGAQGGYARLESDFASPFGSSASASRRATGRAQIDIGLASGLDLSAGVEALRERASSTFITGASSQQIPIERTIAGYFGEGRWRSRDRLFVTAGIRIEDIRRDAIEPSPSPFSPRPTLPADNVVSVNPRLSAAWLAHSSGTSYSRVRGAVGTGIRPPDAFELAFTDNPGLQPERSISGELGADQAFLGGRGLVEATAFFNDYDDLIVAVGSFSGASRFQTDNISNARSRGLELAVTLRGRIAARADLAARVGYTWLDTEVLAVDGGESAPPPFAVGQALLRRPRHQFFADVSSTSGPVTVFLRGGGRGRVLDVEPSLGTFGGLFDADGYSVWDIGGSVRAGRFLEVFARVDNLFDRAYEEALGFPGLGRRASIGVRVAGSR